MQVQAVQDHTYSLASLPLHVLQHIAKHLDLCSQLRLSQASKRVYPFLPVQYRRGYCCADRQAVDRTLEDSFVLNGIDLLSRLPCYFSQTDSHVAVLYIEVNAYDIAQVAAITHSDAQYHLCITQYDPCGSSERKRGHLKHAGDKVLLNQTLSKEQLHTKLGHAPVRICHIRPDSGSGNRAVVCRSPSARLELSSKKGISLAEMRHCAGYCYQLMHDAKSMQADLYIKFADKVANKQYWLNISRTQVTEMASGFRWVESAEWQVDQMEPLISPVALDFDSFPLEATGVSAYFYSDMAYEWQQPDLIYITNRSAPNDALFEACSSFVYTKNLGHCNAYHRAAAKVKIVPVW